MKVLSHIKRQLQKNNDGASLVNVLLIASLAVVLVSAILVAVMYNFFMKNQNIASQQNFYNAETAMEEIRMGLTVEASEAAAVAYTDTLSRYDNMTKDERKEYFQKKYLECLQDKLLVQKGQIWYDIDTLSSYIKEGKWDGNEGARIVTEQGHNALNNEGEKGVVLTNVEVLCIDKKGNQTQIQSDIVLNYPPIDFSDAQTMENILTYGIIAQEAYVQEQSGETKITGNAYLGELATIKNGQLSIQGVDGAKAMMITGGDLLADVGGEILAEHTEVWAKNIVLSDAANYDAKDGQLYLANDMVLNRGATAKISGEFYGFGNPEAAKLVSCLDADAVATQEADYSSSVILNGKNASLDLQQLSRLLISGVSYINGGENSSIKTGQSVMTKGDQRAYLIPGELIGAGYTYGGANPMVASAGGQYEKLLEEIKVAKGYTTIDEIAVEDFISFQKVIPGVGGTLESIGAGKDFDMAAIQVPGVGTMLYFFMKFDSQEQLNQFTRRYYQTTSNYNRLKDNLEYYAGGGVMMPSTSKDVYDFYLQGNALSNPGASLMVSDTLTTDKNTPKVKQERMQLEKELYEKYAALTCALTKDFDRYNTNKIYENLICKEISATKTFTDDEGNVAVVTGGNYTIANRNPRVKLVIAEGDVMVGRDFEGLIISKGTIEVKSGCDVTADAPGVAVLLQSKDIDGNSPADYIKDVERYLVGGTGDTDESTDSVAISEQVTFRNWKKK